jgi:hypothetical protein
MSFLPTSQLLLWEAGWFWGERNRRFHILQGKPALLGAGTNLDRAIL